MSTDEPRSYQQMCPLAIALDHVGDRWTLLIIRELFGGATRFGQLHQALAGVSTNLLTDRLRKLEASGVLERHMDGSDGIYALTAIGERLRPAVELLGLWGLEIGPVPGTQLNTVGGARSAAMGLQAVLQRCQVPEQTTVIQLDVDGEPMTAVFGGGSPAVRYGEATRPDAVLAVGLVALAELPFKGLDPDHLNVVSGDANVAEEFVQMLQAFQPEQPA